MSKKIETYFQDFDVDVRSKYVPRDFGDQDPRRQSDSLVYAVSSAVTPFVIRRCCELEQGKFLVIPEAAFDIVFTALVKSFDEIEASLSLQSEDEAE